MTSGLDSSAVSAHAVRARKSTSRKVCADRARAPLGFSAEVEQWLLAHDWPGNVRELRNTVERGAVLGRGERVELSDIVLDAPARSGAAATTFPRLQARLDAAPAAHIRDALGRADGERVDAARLLGVERTTLHRLIERYEIE